jgi:hypothetical protein
MTPGRRPSRVLGPLAALVALVALVMPGAAGAADAPRGGSTAGPVTAGNGRRVLLITADLGSEIAPAVLARLRGELRAARFEMDVATVASDAPRRSTVEELAAHGGANAALGIFVSAGRVEMWAADAVAGRTLMQNLPLDVGTPERRAAIVAVKAVDLLKATLAELWPTVPTPAGATVVSDERSGPGARGTVAPEVPAPIAAAEVVVAAAEPPKRERFSISAGAGWQQAGSIRGWAPIVALSAAIGGGPLAVRLTLSALGQTAVVGATDGNAAALAQEIGLAELVLWSRVWHHLRGALALGAGAHHLSVDGRAVPGFIGLTHDLWSFATTAGVGLSLELLPHLALAFDARAVENWPATRVKVSDTQTAGIGRPIVWLALSAGVTFR